MFVVAQRKRKVNHHVSKSKITDFQHPLAAVTFNQRGNRDPERTIYELDTVAKSPLLDVKNQGMLMDLPYPLIPNLFQTLLAIGSFNEALNDQEEVCGQTRESLYSL